MTDIVERLDWLHKEIEDLEEVSIKHCCVLIDAQIEVENLRELIRDAMEDETEFDTEWDRAARAALGVK